MNLRFYRDMWDEPKPFPSDVLFLSLTPSQYSALLGLPLRRCATNTHLLLPSISFSGNRSYITPSFTELGCIGAAVYWMSYTAHSGSGSGTLLAVDDETLASLAAAAEGSRHPTLHEYLVYCSSSPRPGTTIGQMKSASFHAFHFKASSSEPSFSFKAHNGVMYGLGSDHSYQWCKYLHSAWPWFDS